MTPVINGRVVCPHCHDQLPTTSLPHEWAWVTCRNCGGATISGRVHPLHPERAA